MNWLTQNWIWVAIALAIAWLVLRGSLGGHAGGHGGEYIGGMGHGAHGYVGEEGQPGRPTDASTPEAAIDPVSGEAVRTTNALTSIHEGKIYYFASRENRDRFEAAPHEYAQKAMGQPIRIAASERHHHRGGC